MFKNPECVAVHHRSMHIIGLTTLMLFGVAGVSAQTMTLPKPARAVFKCIVAGKTVYSDGPCVGAQRVDVEPTRGVSKLSGKELTGEDVRIEKHREQIVEALQPLAPIDAKQFDVQVRRYNLKPKVKSECAHLDASIARTEAEEREANSETRAEVQRDLFSLRKQYRALRC